MIGNLRYLSPEQVRGEKALDLSDIWGLGVLAWEILAGRGPFDRDSVAATMRASLRGDAPRLDTACSGIPGAYATLFDRCLALDPETRPTAAEIAGALAKPGAELPFPVSGGRREAIWQSWLLHAQLESACRHVRPGVGTSDCD